MIDSGLVSNWQPSVVAAAKRFEQGDLIEHPPFFYAARPALGTWQTTLALADDEATDDTIVIEVDPDDGPQYGIITTPGCDIDNTTVKPWIQVAPVYPLDQIANADGRLGDIRRDAIPYLVLLEPPGIDGLWVADLRIEVPVEKSVLAHRTPLPGFADETDRRWFARRLAGRLERPALPESVHDTVVRPLHRLLQRANNTLSVALGESKIEFRLAHTGDPDQLQTVRLYVVARNGAAVPDIVTAAVNRWWSELPNHADVTTLDCRFGSSDNFTMREYLTSELLDDRFLDS